jgi:hypothetical protein
MTQSREVRAGDVIDVGGHSVGDAHRIGEILEVIAGAAREHYRVRWEDGRETIVYPAGDIVVRAARKHVHGNGNGNG